jgi:transposase
VYFYAEAGRNLGVNLNLLSRWKREFEAIELHPGSSAAMQAELKRLRKENKRLKMLWRMGTKNESSEISRAPR